MITSDLEAKKIIRVFNEDLFPKVIGEIKAEGYPVLKTHFTDLQAKNICSKMANHKIRYFSSIFQAESEKLQTEKLRYQIHFLANKSLKLYGGQIISFIYGLKPWRNLLRESDLLISKLDDMRSVDTNFPELKIESGESGFNFSIKFKRVYERPYSSMPVITVRNNATNRITTITRDGNLIYDFENIEPEILLFLQNINGDFELYSGYDDDMCDICGRLLTDPVSIKYGRGPSCRKFYGIP